MYTGYILLFKRMLYRREFGDSRADKIILNVILAMTIILCIFFCITDLGNSNVRIWSRKLSFVC